MKNNTCYDVNLNELEKCIFGSSDILIDRIDEIEIKPIDDNKYVDITAKFGIYVENSSLDKLNYLKIKNDRSNSCVKPEIYTKEDNDNIIKDYQILCPGKVVKVDFTDNTSEKMILKDPDVFDIHRCLFIAIAKHLYKDIFTPEGIEYKATLLSYEKKYAKIVDSAIKNHEKKEKEKLLKLQKEKEEKERIKRKRAKNLKRREQLRKKRIEEQIEIQKKAIIRANSGSDEDVKK